jgi:type IV pilus assembly protein PilB
MLQFDEEKQDRRVKELKEREEEELAVVLAQKYNIGYKDLTLTPIEGDALRLVSEDIARKGNFVPFNTLGKRVDIGVLSPNNDEVKEIVTNLEGRGFKPELYKVSSMSLAHAWEQYKDLSFAHESKAGLLDISNDEIKRILSEVKDLEGLKVMVAETLSLKKSSRISRIVEVIVAGALSTGASDIHIEPEEENARLRFRLDGVLTDIAFFDKETFNLLLSRIKLLSGMKLNVKTTSQDGRFTIKIDQSEIEIRTSLMPGVYSESVVMRVLDPKTIGVSMEELGIEPSLFEILKHEIHRPTGMILTTGPTGSGKTTTLYAFLKKIHTPDIKIITIENPIEYHLPGIVQTQINEEAGYTFLEGLGSALRHNPNVIMVGEIRDNEPETAKTAINASLTGHIVFSTLHTNSAAGAFPRLVTLGVDPKVMVSSINIVLGQRLVRILCEHCKKEVLVDEKTKVVIEQVLTTIVRKELVAGLQHEKVFEAVGCPFCSKTGYKGRVGIYEAVRMTEEIEKAVQQNMSEREIQGVAVGQGILTMRQDAIIKVLKGVTSFDEIGRVIDLAANA